mmetsp:Transcript_1333/g.1445  ORF Transcript_1333/g.1445 Transcript_1333/m.1445 type:complete len:335 (-) Transcript_1333:1233-2237(-)
MHLFFRFCISYGLLSLIKPSSVVSFLPRPLNLVRKSPTEQRIISKCHQFVQSSKTPIELEVVGVAQALSIEYCTGCRWLYRSAWLMQELFTTFDEEMTTITLIPSKPPSPGGTFLIKLNKETIWDRREDGGFPESKVLKQRVRDKIDPAKDLGHSDSKESSAQIQQQESSKNGKDLDCPECDERNQNLVKNETQNHVTSSQFIEEAMSGSKNVKIVYCADCEWMLRSSWICQELLMTFEIELNSVTLAPSRSPIPGGLFNILIDETLIFDRKEEGSFPEIEQLKKRVRDIVSPEKKLEHIDDSLTSGDCKEELNDIDELDDDSAADLRNFYGVL